MELHRVIAALRRSAGLLALAALNAFVVAAAVGAVRPDVYEADAFVDVARLVGDDAAFSSGERADRTVAGELVIAEDQQVAARAAERLGVDVGELQDDVSVEQLTGTDNLRFTAVAREPREAARVATGYAEAYAAARLEQRRAVVRAQAEDVSRQLAELQRQLDPLGGLPLPDEARQQALREQYAQLVGREVELRTSDLPEADGGLALLPAPVPSGPAGFGPVAWGAAAALLALALGGLVVAARARSRDPVELRSDLQDLGLPVLAEAAPARGWRRSRGARAAPAALVDEAVRGMTRAGTVPAAVVVTSVDGHGHEDFVRALGERLEERGVDVVRPEPGAAGGGTQASTSSRSTTLVDATAARTDTERVRCAELADVLLLVVVRGVTGRADLARTVEQLQRVSPDGRRGEAGARRPGQGDEVSCFGVLLDADR